MALKETTKQIIEFFHLDAELEHHDYVHEEIKKGIVFKGTNLWILIFAIIIASVGLNMNSTAVIIGAMLISPLMGPINGMGYSIATYDFELFKKAVKNFSFAILAGLIASTTYFFISPVSTANSELWARTSPTIYDVLIALFGGLAGIVAMSSKLKGNVIAGVAIATALMPPLCTAGYGLATLQFNFFFGAIYLFTINTIFIGLATLWTSQILKFPIRTIVDPKRSKKINQVITVVIVLVIGPSLYFGYKLVQKEKFNLNAIQYVNNIEDFEGNYLIKHSIDANNKIINLEYAGATLSEAQKRSIKLKAFDFELDSIHVKIDKGFSMGHFDEQTKELIMMREQIDKLNNELDTRQIKIDSLTQAPLFGRILLKEISTFYPQIEGCSFSETFIYHDSLQQAQAINIIVFDHGDKPLLPQDRKKIEQWVNQRLEGKTLKVIFE
jgi:uncharacterized hydrophobic protein (TIGR00271 family)